MNTWYNRSVEAQCNGALCFSSKAVVYPYNLLAISQSGIVGKAPPRTWTFRVPPALRQRRQRSRGCFAMPASWYIYALTEPHTNEIRYVGWTIDPQKRYVAHIQNASHQRNHKSNWIKGLVRAGLRPGILILETGNGDWQEAERWWIAHLRQNGANLTNMTDGGDGTPGLIPNAETRSKMSLSRRGRKMPPEAIAKTAAALRGRTQSPEHIARLAKTRKGKAPIPATEAAAIANRGRRQSPEHVAKRIAPRKGIEASWRKQSRTIDDVVFWQCSMCDEWKPETTFVRCKSNWNGIKSFCKDCHALNQRRLRRNG